MPSLLARSLVGLFWIGLAFLGFQHRVPRVLLSLLAAVPAAAAAGFVTFGFADEWFGKLFPSRARGDWVVIVLGVLIGALGGIYVGWMGGRVTWLYWLIQALIVALFVFVPIWT